MLDSYLFAHSDRCVICFTVQEQLSSVSEIA